MDRLRSLDGRSGRSCPDLRRPAFCPDLVWAVPQRRRQHHLAGQSGVGRTPSDQPPARATSSMPMDSQRGFYRPLGQASWLFSALISGADPAGWRITNLLLHLLNGWLVYRLVRRAWRGPAEARPSAWLAAAAFWLYPLAPEATVWIAGRYDLLALAGALFACERHLASQRLFDTPRLLEPGRRWPSRLARRKLRSPRLPCFSCSVSPPLKCDPSALAASELADSLRRCAACATACLLWPLLAAYFLLRKSLFGDADTGLFGAPTRCLPSIQQNS